MIRCSHPKGFNFDSQNQIRRGSQVPYLEVASARRDNPQRCLKSKPIGESLLNSTPLPPNKRHKLRSQINNRTPAWQPFAGPKSGPLTIAHLNPASRLKECNYIFFGSLL